MKKTMTVLLAICWASIMISCGGSDGSGDPDPGPEGEEELILKMSEDTISNNGSDAVIFTVMLGDKDVTVGSTISEQVSHKEIEGALFAPEKGIPAGKYVFRAEYRKMTSPSVTLHVVETDWFIRHALVQWKTSTFCVFCGSMMDVLEQELAQLSPGRIDFMAFHGNMTAGVDPFTVSYTGLLFDKFGMGGYPQVLIDHYKDWSTSGLENQVVQSELDEPGMVGIALETALSGKQLTVNVGVKSQVNFEKPCRVAVAVLENGLDAPQMGKMETHNWVVRSYLSDLFGDAQDSGEGKIAIGHEWNKQYTYTIPADYVTENMDVVAYVLDGSEKAINSRKVKVGEKADYEWGK